MRTLLTILFLLPFQSSNAFAQDRSDSQAAEQMREAGRAWARSLTDAIAARWERPEAVADDLRCKLRIEIDRAGTIETVRIIKPSGNRVFDNSAELAIRRASPLPLPADPRAFSRILEPTFTPQSLARDRRK